MRCRFLTLLVAPAASLRPEASLRRGIVWDVDGTLVDSTRLGFDASNEVLARNGYAAISADEYAVGAKFSTPDRFSWHVGAAAGSGAGAALGRAFDACYVARVDAETAGAFDGVDRLLRRLRCPQGALSNANGAYVRAVLAANGFDGGLFGVVAMPHYFFELCAWLGVALVAQQLNALLVFGGMASYLGGRAVATSRWYRAQFGAAWPVGRRHLVPFVF